MEFTALVMLNRVAIIEPADVAEQREYLDDLAKTSKVGRSMIVDSAIPLVLTPIVIILLKLDMTEFHQVIAKVSLLSLLFITVSGFVAAVYMKNQYKKAQQAFASDKPHYVSVFWNRASVSFVTLFGWLGVIIGIGGLMYLSFMLIIGKL